MSSDTPWTRLHPLSPLLRGGLVLLVIIGVIVANLRDRLVELFVLEQYVQELDAGEPGELGDELGANGDVIGFIEFLAARQQLILAILTVLVFVLLIVAAAWLSWRFATFRITDEAVESRQGVLFTQHRRAPLDRIQSVNLQRSLLARIVGLTQVEVQTAGQGGSVELKYLGHRDAKLVREQILLATSTVARSHLTDDAQQDPGSLIDRHLRDAADVDIDPMASQTGALIRVPFGRLVASILLGTEVLIVLPIIIGIAIGARWLPTGSVLGVLVLGAILVSVLLSQLNKGFHFVLSRAEDGVRVGAGLTSTITETIPFGRIHAVEAVQPIGWRAFGWWKVRITTAGHEVSQGGQNRLQNVVLPVGEVDDVVRVFETVLHRDQEGAADRASALRDALTGSGAGFVRASPHAWVVLWFGRRRAGMRIEHTVPDTTHPSSTHGVPPQFSLRIRRGWFNRSLVEMPLQRAQSIEFARPIVHRLLGLASISAHTVLGPVLVRMRGLSLHDAALMFDELATAIVIAQLEEPIRPESDVQRLSLGARVNTPTPSTELGHFNESESHQ